MTDTQAAAVRQVIAEMRAHTGPNSGAYGHVIEQWADELEAALGEAPASPWRDIATAPKDGTPFMVYWNRSRMWEPFIDMVGGWTEYQEILSFGEPPAMCWHPLPERPTLPMSAPEP